MATKTEYVTAMKDVRRKVKGEGPQMQPHGDGFAFGAARRRLRLSQDDVTELSGVRLGRLSDYESGRRELTESEMAALAKSLSEYEAAWAQVRQVMGTD